MFYLLIRYCWKLNKVRAPLHTVESHCILRVDSITISDISHRMVLAIRVPFLLQCLPANGWHFNFRSVRITGRIFFIAHNMERINCEIFLPACIIR